MTQPRVDHTTELRTLARKLHGWGGNVTLIKRGAKEPAHKWAHWQHERQSEADFNRLPWGGYTTKDGERVTIGAIGIVNGSGDIRAIDIDAPKDSDGYARYVVPESVLQRALKAMGLPTAYQWAGRSGGLTRDGENAGWRIFVRCKGEIPAGRVSETTAGVYSAPPKDGLQFDHVELRWSRGQTVVEGEHPSGGRYQWLYEPRPFVAPAEIDVDRVLAGVAAIAELPQDTEGNAPHNGQTADGDDLAEQIRRQFDVLAYAKRELTYDAETESGGNVKLGGNGGFFVAPDTGEWYCHAEDVGGDCFDLVGYIQYGASWFNDKRARWGDVLREAASFAGVALPEQQNTTPSANGNGPAHNAPEGEPAKGWTVTLADAICEENYFAMGEGGELHYYEGGRYHPRGKRHIQRCVKRLLLAWGRESVFTSYRANEVAAYIAADAPVLWAKPPAGKLNVGNGILDLESHELLPHTPDWLSTVQIPVNYDPQATCPAWERFIGDWFPEDAQETPWELLAWLMSLDVSLQKAALLLGNGENGKSRFLAAVRAFIGGRSVAALSLQQIENSRWATHHLNGKLANICPDLPAAHLDTTSTFKALTGGDRIPAEMKHGKLYEYQPFVRLMFSANQPPQSKDASRAFFRRWVVIPFDATFTPEERLPEATIDAMLADPNELSGALNRALDALPTVKRHGITETESMREAALEFHEVTDPVEVWLETNTVEAPDAYVVKGDLSKAYNEAARSNGWPVLTGRQFSMRVKDWRPMLRDGQKRVGDSRPKVWYGIGLKTSDIRKKSE